MMTLEYIEGRLRALLDGRAVTVPNEATDRIAALEHQLAEANALLLAIAADRDRLLVELPALAQAVANTQARFDELIIDARAEVPLGTQEHVASLEKRLADAESRAVAADKERDESRRMCEELAILRDAALRWRKDNYTPRLQAAIDAFSRREVSKR